MVLDDVNGAPARPADDVRERTGAQMVWDVLEREGVEVCFGYPGGAIMPTYDALPESKVRHVLTRHEQGASHMADGYARASGKVGVAIATSGPGATNLVTGIATAMLDSVPMVCITGQVPSHLLGSDAFQETDICGVTLPITKHNYLVTRAEDVGPTLQEAFAVARSGRPGPVLVDITKDAQLGSAVFDPNRPVRLRPAPQPATASAEVEHALRLIAAAERPLILAGQGVVHAGATEALVAFAERADIPISTTLLGIGGVPASHPLNLGMPGMHGEAWVNEAIQQADLLIAVGMRFDDRVTGNPTRFAPQARKIHLELDPAEVGKNIAVDVAMVGDARESLEALLERLPELDHAAWRHTIGARRDQAGDRELLNRPCDGKLYAAQVLHDLWRLTEGRALVVSDVGQHQMWEAQYYKHERPRSLLTSGGLGTMGFALPAAMGARLARPADEEVWVVVGDGGFQMTACELSTCAQEGLKVNVAIVNNGHLGMVRQWQEFFYGGRYVATPLHNPDFVKLTEAHGLTGIRVTERDQLEAAVRTAQATPGTVVLDIRVVEHDAVYPMVPAGHDVDDMIRRPEGD